MKPWENDYFYLFCHILILNFTDLRAMQFEVTL